VNGESIFLKCDSTVEITFFFRAWSISSPDPAIFFSSRRNSLALFKSFSPPTVVQKIVILLLDSDGF